MPARNAGHGRLPSSHPLRGILAEAAQGHTTGYGCEFLPRAEGATAAIVAITGYLVVAADLDPAIVHSKLTDRNDLVAPLQPAFQLWLASAVNCEPANLNTVLAATSSSRAPSPLLVRLRMDLDHHPRVFRAMRLRKDVVVYGDIEDRGIAVLGRGLAGRWELSFEVYDQYRGRGLGRQLAEAAMSTIPEDEPLFAQVAPGNAASIRSLQAAGFRPIGCEVLFTQTRSATDAAQGS